MSTTQHEEIENSVSDAPIAVIALMAIASMAYFIMQDVSSRHALLFIIGTGLGISLFHASFGFTGGWRRFIRERDGLAVRAHILLFALATLATVPVVAGIYPGLSAGPALGPVGISVIAGSFMFGVGMQLGGGCGSGTLFTVGGGHVRMLITLAFFVAGATIGSLHLGWWTALPAIGKISLIQQFGWQGAIAFQLLILGLIYTLVVTIEKRSHTPPSPLLTEEAIPRSAGRLLFGPWPLVWGAVALAALSFLTLVIAGHPWSITFAYSLWGAKIWTALGGDLSGWAFWSGGYPAKALGRTVLADITSIMDFGIILGAVLAASLAQKFAPAGKLNAAQFLTAVIGGLLLGYGSRLAFGCNIGALLGGISSASVHGWVWLLFGFLGNIAGTHLRVMFNIDPPIGTKI